MSAGIAAGRLAEERRAWRKVLEKKGHALRTSALER
jgi:hypothetical protein